MIRAGVPNIARLMKSRLRWLGYVGRMEDPWN